MRELRSLDPAVRGIVSSGYSNDPVLANPREHGFVDRLEKPYDLDELALVVGRVLEAQVGPSIPHGHSEASGRTQDNEFLSIHDHLGKRHRLH